MEMLERMNYMEISVLDSILYSIKKMLGIDKDYTAFDTDVIIHINTALFNLHQLGVGKTENAFSIQDKNSKWSDFLEDDKNFEAVKSYIYLKVRLLFDPPASSSVIDAIKRSIDELEWRLQVEADPYPSEESIQNDVI